MCIGHQDNPQTPRILDTAPDGSEIPGSATGHAPYIEKYYVSQVK